MEGRRTYRRSELCYWSLYGPIDQSCGHRSIDQEMAVRSGNLGEIRIASSKNAPERIAYCLTRMLPMPC